MRTILSVVILILCFNFAQGQGLCLVGGELPDIQHGKSLGIIAGEPTGLSARWEHLSCGASWSFTEERFLDMNLNYLVYFPIYRYWGESVDMYWGYGGRVIFQDKERYGFRFPLGLLYQLEYAEVFGEFAPIMDLYPSSEINCDIGIGIRYCFK